MNVQPHPRRVRLFTRQRAFTLVELLAVMAIMITLMAVGIGGMSSLRNSIGLTQTAEIVSGRMQAARLEALSTNRAVEVRFYKFRDAFAGDADERFRGMQTFVQRDNGELRAIYKFFRLPSTVVALETAQHSPLLTDAGLVEGTGEVPGSVGMIDDAQYVAFRFRPDGSTTLPSDAPAGWYLTVANERDVIAAGEGELPPNFATIQVDPLNGSVRLHRPGA